MSAIRFAALAAFAPLSAAPGQVAVYASAGARASSALVYDSIVTRLELRPHFGPALGLSVELPQRAGWAVDGKVELSWSELRRQDAVATVGLGTLGALSFSVGLRRALTPRFTTALRVGALRYLPSRQEGVFASGGGGVIPLVGLTTVLAGSSPRFSAEATYDLHRFITPALRDHGFQDPLVVHRFTLAFRAGLVQL